MVMQMMPKECSSQHGGRRPRGVLATPLGFTRAVTTEPATVLRVRRFSDIAWCFMRYNALLFETNFANAQSRFPSWRVSRLHA